MIPHTNIRVPWRILNSSICHPCETRFDLSQVNTGSDISFLLSFHQGSLHWQSYITTVLVLWPVVSHPSPLMCDEGTITHDRQRKVNDFMRTICRSLVLTDSVREAPVRQSERESWKVLQGFHDFTYNMRWCVCKGLIWAWHNCDPWIGNVTLMPHIARTQRQTLHSKAPKGRVICCCPWYCNESSWSPNVLISNHYWRADLKACTASGQMVPAPTYWWSIKRQNIHKHPWVTHTFLTISTIYKCGLEAQPGFILAVCSSW